MHRCIVTLFVALTLAAAACSGGDDGEPPPKDRTPTAVPTTPVELATAPAAVPTPGSAPEVLFRDDIDGRILLILEYRASDDTYFATVTAPTIEGYREGKAAMEERLPSLVPNPCDVLWTLPALLADELEPADLRTSGCQ
jgi:hypothetical protein